MPKEIREVEHYMPAQIGKSNLIAQSARGYFDQNQLISGVLTQVYDVGGQPVRFISEGKFREGKLLEGKKTQGGVLVQENKIDLSRRSIVTSFDKNGRPHKKVYVSKNGEWIKTELYEHGRIAMVREPNVFLGITNFRQYNSDTGRAEATGYVLFDREIPYPNIHRLKELPAELETVTLRDINRRVVYEGELLRFMPHGTGKAYNRMGGLAYEGPFDYGLRHGSGISYGPDDQKNTVPEYIGTFSEDKYHGEGTLHDLSDGVGSHKLYEGSWQNGLLTKGAQYKGDTLIYEGEFHGRAEDGHFFHHGEGTVFHENGLLFFKGQFVYDMFTGDNAEVFNPDGTKYYEGDLVEGLCGHSGVVSLPDGTTLEQTSNFDSMIDATETDIIHYAESGMVLYQGGADLMTDGAASGMEHITKYKRQRSGIINFPNGERFEGVFKDNLRSGPGIHYYTDGSVKFQGAFLEDQYHGECAEYLPDGTALFQGFFERDRCIRGEGTFQFEEEEYAGHIENGCRTGRGVVKYHSGTLKYRGGFENNLYSSDGEEFFQNGNSRYVGNYANGLFDGHGLLYAEYGDLIYDGSWAQGLRHGEGKLYAPDGSYYEGGFSDDLKSGAGLDFYADGFLRYEGSFLLGKESGQGKLYDPEGRLIYEGEWAQGEYSGEGKSYYSNGNLHYTGTFMHGLLNGAGCLYDEEGYLRFEGNWENGQRSGEGRIYYKNKESFSGTIIDGKKQKFGRYYYKNGLLAYEGDYVDNKRHGNGTAYDLSGNLHYRGQWVLGHKDGQGSQFSGDGVLVYEGGYKKGKFHGAGKYYSGDNVLYYDGEFDQGKRNGYGLHYNKAGIRDYAGYYEEGHRSGFGISYSSDGEHVMYSGFWRRGKYHGCGVIYLHDQPRFSGMFLDGKMSGRINEIDDGRIIREAIYDNGQAVYQRSYDQADTLVYEGGACLNGLPDGDGISYDGLGNVTFKGRFNHGIPVSLGAFLRKTVEPIPEIPELGTHDFNIYRTKRVYNILGVELEKGTRLFCTLEDGIPIGIGSAVFHDGRKYYGPFQDGRPTGSGTVIGFDGRRFTGEIFDGHPHGHGILSMPDGDRYEGEFNSMLRNNSLKVLCANGDIVHAQFRDDMQVSHAVQYKFVEQSLQRFPDSLSERPNAGTSPAAPAQVHSVEQILPVATAQQAYQEGYARGQEGYIQNQERQRANDKNQYAPVVAEPSRAPHKPQPRPAASGQIAPPSQGAVYQNAADNFHDYSIEFDALLSNAESGGFTVNIENVVSSEPLPPEYQALPDDYEDSLQQAQNALMEWDAED